MNLKYLLGALITIPLLPLMYYQGKRIRQRVPQLPEAKGKEGTCEVNGSTSHTLNLITIGESTIAGVGVETHEEGFTGTLANEISRLFHSNVEWKVYARSGYTARKVKKKLIPKINETQANLVVVGLGGNDAFALRSPSKWKSDIQSLIESIQSKFPKAIIVFCNMPPIKEFPAFTPLIKFTVGNLVEIFGDELHNTIRKFDNVFHCGETITLKGWIDKFQLNATLEDFFSDGVHPSKLTYQTWAKDIANEVFRNEKIKKALVPRNSGQSPHEK